MPDNQWEFFHRFGGRQFRQEEIEPPIDIWRNLFGYSKPKVSQFVARCPEPSDPVLMMALLPTAQCHDLGIQ